MVSGGVICRLWVPAEKIRTLHSPDLVRVTLADGLGGEEEGALGIVRMVVHMDMVCGWHGDTAVSADRGHTWGLWTPLEAVILDEDKTVSIVRSLGLATRWEEVRGREVKVKLV